MEIVASLAGDVPPIKSDKAVRNAWQAYTALADRYNEPGTFHGADRLRVDGHRRLQPPPQRDLPRRRERGEPHAAVLAVRQQEPRGPLEAPRRVREATGAEVLAIPHNGNLSNGRMFTVETFDGKPLTEELAATRARIGAAGRGHPDQGRRRSAPVLSPNDEFAGYEIWDKSNLNGTEAKTPEMLK